MKILDVNPLDAHDRLLHLKKEQSINIFNGAEDCLKKNALSLALQEYSPYIYIFAHPRTEDCGSTKVMYWQPRLTKPKAQTNSYLFRAQSKTDLIEIMWLLPPRELWNQYKDKNVTESRDICISIQNFLTKRHELEKPEVGDLSDESIKTIYAQIALRKSKPKTLGA